MMLWTGIKIVCLVSWSIMTRIVSNIEDNKSFLMKSIEIKFYSHLGIESCLRDL